MKKFTAFVCAVAFSVFGIATSIAQPPGGQGGPPGGGPPGGQEFGPPPPSPLFEALDKNHDGQISADEIADAKKSLEGLDANGDGILSEEEVHPGPPPGMEGPPNGPGQQRRPGGDLQQRPGQNVAGQNNRPPQFNPQGGQPGPGGPPGAEGPRGQNGPPAGRPPMNDPQQPTPDRFVQHALQFDTNGDGQLSRDELMAFAQQMPVQNAAQGGGPQQGQGPSQGRAGQRRQGGPGGPGGPGGGQGAGPGQRGGGL